MFKPLSGLLFMGALLGTPACSHAPSPVLPRQPPAAAACHDFNAYINGAWEAATELPPDRARVGSFDGLRQANDRVLQKALAALAAEPTRALTPCLQRLAACYRSGMDEAAVQQRGLVAVAPLLTRIAADERAGLPALLGELARLQVELPLRLSVGPDAKDATRHRVQAFQSGLGLPDREDYLKGDATAQRITAGYRLYAQRLLQAPGAPASDAMLNGVLALETELARASMNPVQRRNPNALYNPHTTASLQVLAPGFDWQAGLQAYASADAPDSLAEQRPSALSQAHFDYKNGVLRGLQTPPPRAERLITLIGGATGNAPLEHQRPHRQRLRFAGQPHRVPGRHPAAALFRCRRRHAGVCASVWLQGRRRDSGRRAHPHLVTPASFPGGCCVTTRYATHNHHPRPNPHRRAV